MVGPLRRMDFGHGARLGAGEHGGALGPIGLQVLLQDRSWIKTVVTALGGATGIATALLGFSTRSAAAKKEGGRSGSWLVLGAIVFLGFLLVYIAFATSWLEAKLFGVSTAAPSG